MFGSSSHNLNHHNQFDSKHHEYPEHHIQYCKYLQYHVNHNQYRYDIYWLHISFYHDFKYNQFLNIFDRQHRVYSVHNE